MSELQRAPGSLLTTHERSLLDLLCADGWPGAEAARAQLACARWGGQDHDDACFLLVVPSDLDLPRVPPHDGGPVNVLEVVDGDEPLGMLELWVDGGLLHSLDYTTWGEQPTTLPAAEQVVAPEPRAS